MKFNQIFRSLFRNPLNSLIIIISLAIGMACINLIMLFVTRELNTDSFQQNRDRIYLLKCDNPYEQRSLKCQTARKGGAEYIKENFSQVEDFCRIRVRRAQKVMAGNQIYTAIIFQYLRPQRTFLTFSHTRLLTDNPNTVLATKDDIAISEELAQKYFGEKLPVGRIITIINGDTKDGLYRKRDLQKTC